MFTQKITVNTKGQLIAAFQCAIFSEYAGYPFFTSDDDIKTEITLVRKSGVTKYHLRMANKIRQERGIRRAITNIRRIPEAVLLA